MGCIGTPKTFHPDGINADITFMVSEKPALCSKVTTKINNSEIWGNNL